MFCLLLLGRKKEREREKQKEKLGEGVPQGQTHTLLTVLHRFFLVVRCN
jgi:hypothetical protein